MSTNLPNDDDARDTVASSRNRRDGILQVALVIGVLVLGVLANFVLSLGSTEPQVKVAGADRIVVDLVQPAIRDTAIRIVETGTVQVQNAIELSPQVGGRVVAMSPNLASGGHFKAGEVLFRLDGADYEAAVNRSLADVSAAQADLRVERAEADVARQEWALVHPDEPIPPLVAREPQISRAEASVQSAQAALADARLDLSRVQFSLPFDGRILSTTIKVGQNLSPGQSYGRVYETDDIEVALPINAAALEGLSPSVGRDAVVRATTQPRRDVAAYPAVVTRADAELDPQTRLARLTLAFVEPVPLLPGEFVEAEIAGPVVAGAYLIPERAVSDNRSVWVVDNGVLARREPRFIFARDGEIAALPFDAADGVVVSTLVDPAEGAAVEIARRAGDGGDPQ
ncbi:MAG: efflux RND transporter periplasmic adaptor subunit [Pseudomonadota bacterium]